jgi:hypothetical protein
MKRLRSHFVLLTLFLVALLASCDKTKPPSLTVSPKTQTVNAGSAAFKLTAAVENSSTPVIWTLTGGGTLSATKGESIDYTPPASVSSDTAIEITATLEGTKIADKATITVKPTGTTPTPQPTPLPPAPPAISPTAQTLQVGSSAITFTALNADSGTVTWQLTGDGKLSSSTGLNTQYTPPATLGSNTTATLTANFATAKVAVTATITLTDKPVTTGALQITITGLPSGTNADVTVTGPDGFNQKLTATTTLNTLKPGKYTVASKSLTGEGYEYKAAPGSQELELQAGNVRQANIRYDFLQTILFVNASSGADTNQGFKDKPFKTVTKALGNAVAGQTIFLQTGTYSTSTGESFPLRVKSGIALEGETFPGTAIIGSGTCLLLENVNDIRITKLELKCDWGIEMQNAKALSLTYLKVASRELGIVARDSAATLDNVEIYNSLTGLVADGSSQIIVQNSKVFRNGRGVVVRKNAQVTLDKSSVTENGYVGVGAYGKSTLEIKNSHIDNNAYTSVMAPTDKGGIFIEQDAGGTVIIDNTSVNNNDDTGVRVGCGTQSNAGTLRLENSQIMGNEFAGICVGDVTGVTGTISLVNNLFGFNKTMQILDARPDNQPVPIFAPGTSIDDGMGVYQLSDIKTGPAEDANVWKIFGTGNKICFEACL